MNEKEIREKIKSLFLPGDKVFCADWEAVDSSLNSIHPENVLEATVCGYECLDFCKDKKGMYNLSFAYLVEKEGFIVGVGDERTFKTKEEAEAFSSQMRAIEEGLCIEIERTQKHGGFPVAMEIIMKIDDVKRAIRCGTVEDGQEALNALQKL